MTELATPPVAPQCAAVARSCVDDVRFAALAAEVARLAGRGARPTVPWCTLATLGLELLRDFGADPVVAIWTTLAIYRSRGGRSLLVAIERVGLERFAALHSGALDWLIDQLAGDDAQADDVAAGIYLLRGRLRGASAAPGPTISRLLPPPGAARPPGPPAPLRTRIVAAASALSRAIRPLAEEAAPAAGRLRTAAAAPEPAAGHLRTAAEALPPARPTSPPTLVVVTPAADSVDEGRVLEIALPRMLPEDAPTDLYVLLRCLHGRELLERLAAKGFLEFRARDLEALPMTLDHLLSPQGRALPLTLVVEVKTDDFECDDPRRRFCVRLGEDAPLLRFWLRPRRTGNLRLTVEVSLASEVLGAEVLGCLCIERMVWRDRPESYIGSSTVLTRLPAGASTRLAGAATAELALHELLVGLFDAGALYRWISLRFGPWRRDLASPCVSISEMAFSVIETGRRQGAIDDRFFAELGAAFPGCTDSVARVRETWLRDEQTAAVRAKTS